jgi:competence ComEA-like helix-hairpin-helix protein
MKRVFSFFLVVACVSLIAGPALSLVDVNSATQSELESLPGIGPVKAERIIKKRPFRSASDLKRVKGIGPKTAERLKPLVTFGSQWGKKKEKVVKEEPKQIPVYSTAKYRLLKCWRCKNKFKVSNELKSGWCPYCKEQWAIKGVEVASKASSAQQEANPGAKQETNPEAEQETISWRDATRYMGRMKAVKGRIVGTHLSSGSGNLYLNFDPDYKNYISIKIPSTSVRRFRPDAASYYNGKEVIAKGMIKREKGFLRLIVSNPDDLKVAGEMKEEPAAAQGAESSGESLSTPGAISWRVGGQYVGKTESVEGTIVGTYLSTRSSGNLYMNFDPDYRTYISIKIPKLDIIKFRRDAESFYKGKKVVAKGLIEKDHRGYLRLVVTNPDDLKVLD